MPRSNTHYPIHCVFSTTRPDNLITVSYSNSSPAKTPIPVVFALLKSHSVSNKSFIFNYVIISHNLDVLFLTETWLKPEQCSPLQELRPPSSTHNHGHTLELVFTLGMSLNSLNKTEFVSDHKCNTFDAPLLPISITQKRTIHSHIFNEHSAATFSSFFCSLANCPTVFTNVNDLVCWFNEVCPSAFDASTYTSGAVPVINTTPWINNIRQQRREYRRAKRQWKVQKFIISI